MKKALIIGAGQGVWQYGHLKLLKQSLTKGRDFIIIATDRMLSACLDEGITPDYTTTLEDSEEIADFYDRPNESLAVLSLRVNDKVIHAIKDLHMKNMAFDSTIQSITSNVGIFSVAFAYEELKIKEIALIGFDHTDYTAIQNPAWELGVIELNEYLEENPRINLYNCTEQGILDGDRIEWLTLRQWLE